MNKRKAIEDKIIKQLESMKPKPKPKPKKSKAMQYYLNKRSLKVYLNETERKAFLAFVRKQKEIFNRMLLINPNLNTRGQVQREIFFSLDKIEKKLSYIVETKKIKG